MTVYYIYILLDQGTPFYIGKGTGDRAFMHEKIVRGQSRKSEFGLSKDYNPYKTRKIQKIINAGRNVEYEFPFGSVVEDDVYEEEKRLIGLYKRTADGGILTNIHLGGTGGDMWSGLSEKRKKELSEQRRAYRHSDEVKEKIRQSSTGRTHSSATKEKIKQSKIGKSMGVSSKKGKPATGKNAKGVRIAWNKNIAKDDTRSIRHKQGIKQWIEENPNAIRNRCGLSYRLIDPSGNLIVGIGISSLTSKYDVSVRIRDLIRGRTNIYKGWTRADDKDAN